MMMPCPICGGEGVVDGLIVDDQVTGEERCGACGGFGRLEERRAASEQRRVDDRLKAAEHYALQALGAAALTYTQGGLWYDLANAAKDATAAGVTDHDLAPASFVDED